MNPEESTHPSDSARKMRAPAIRGFTAAAPPSTFQLSACFYSPTPSASPLRAANMLGLQSGRATRARGNYDSSRRAELKSRNFLIS